jgi:hypothetical protein
MASAGGDPSWQTMVSVGTSIVPPGPRLPPADPPDASSAAAAPQVTASIHDFAVSLARHRTVYFKRRGTYTPVCRGRVPIPQRRFGHAKGDDESGLP